MRRSLLLLVLVAAVGAVARAVRRRGEMPPSDVGDAVWPPLADVAVAPGPEHSPVRAPGDPQTPVADEPWVLPEDGACPVTHPVKAKVLSGIFHVPGNFGFRHLGKMLQRQRSNGIAILAAAANAGEGDDRADVAAPARQRGRFRGGVKIFALQANGRH